MSHLNSNSPKRAFSAVLIAVAAASSVGCYAPLVSRGIPACQLPDEFRTPYRTLAPELNYFRRDAGVLNNYQAFVRPQRQLAATLRGLQNASRSQQQQLQGVTSQLTPQVTGTNAVFQNYSHYYNFSGARRR